MVHGGSSRTETPATLSARAKRLYRGASGVSALLQTLRPYICPFQEIMPLVPHGATVLDAGCGAGLFLGLLADCGYISSGMGFDSNPAILALAQRMTKHLPARVSIEFRHIDAAAAWPTETFDVVSLIDVLHHLPPASHSWVLSQAIARVRAGGILLYKDMATRPRWRALCNQAHDLVVAHQWVHHVPIAFIEQHASSHGLTVTARGAASCYWYAHEWRVFARPVLSSA